MVSSHTGAADLAVWMSLSTTDSPGGGAVSSASLLLLSLPLLGAGAVGLLPLPVLVGVVVGVVALAVLVAGVSTTVLAEPMT